MADAPRFATENFWCRRQIVVTVRGPDGVPQVTRVGKPYARVGNHPSADVLIDSPDISAQGLYFHATDEGIFCLGLSALGEAGAVTNSWIRRGGRARLGVFRVSASFDDEGPPPNDDLKDPRARNSIEGPAPFFRIESKDGERSTVERVWRRALTLVGRHPPSKLRLVHPTVSKMHCILYWDAGSLWAIDLLSVNGTLLDGRRITCTRVRPGQVMELGHLRLGYVGPSTATDSEVGQAKKSASPKSQDAQGVIRTTEDAEESFDPSDDIGHEGSVPSLPPPGERLPAVAPSDWLAERSVLERRAEQLQAQCQTLRGELDQLRAELNESHQQELQEQESLFDIRIVQLEQTCESLREQLRTAKQEFDEQKRQAQEEREQQGPGKPATPPMSDESAAAPTSTMLLSDAELLAVRWRAESLEKQLAEVQNAAEARVSAERERSVELEEQCRGLRAALEQTRQELQAESQRLLDVQQQQAAEHEAAARRLTETVVLSQAELAEACGKLSQSEGDHAQLRAQLQATLEARQNQITGLEGEMARLRDEFEHRERALREENQAVSQRALEEKRTLEHQLVQLAVEGKNQAQEWSREKHDLDEQLAQLRIESDAQREDSQRALAELASSHEAERSLFRRQADEARQSDETRFASQRSAIEKLVETSQNRIKELEAQLGRTAANLEEHKQAWQAERASLAANLEEREKAWQAERASLAANLEEREKAWQAELASLAAKHQHAVDEAARIRDSATRQLAEAQALAKAELTAAQGRSEELKRELLQERQKLSRRDKASKAERDGLARQVEDLQRQCTSREAELKGIRQDVLGFEEQFASQESKLQQARQCIVELQREAASEQARLQQEIDRLSALLDRKQEEETRASEADQRPLVSRNELTETRPIPGLDWSRSSDQSDNTPTPILPTAALTQASAEAARLANELRVLQSRHDAQQQHVAQLEDRVAVLLRQGRDLERDREQQNRLEAGARESLTKQVSRLRQHLEEARHQLARFQGHGEPAPAGSDDLVESLQEARQALIDHRQAYENSLAEAREKAAQRVQQYERERSELLADARRRESELQAELLALKERLSGGEDVLGTRLALDSRAAQNVSGRRKT